MTQQYLQTHSIIVNELGLKQNSRPQVKNDPGQKESPAGRPGRALQFEHPALSRRFTCRAAVGRRAIACSGVSEIEVRRRRGSHALGRQSPGRFHLDAIIQAMSSPTKSGVAGAAAGGSAGLCFRNGTIMNGHDAFLSAALSRRTLSKGAGQYLCRRFVFRPRNMANERLYIIITALDFALGMSGD
jgi:hypothetical protein